MIKSESYESEMLQIKASDQFNWHERLIHAVGMSEVSPDDMLRKYDEIYRIHKEFGAIATFFGRVIIREYFLPLDLKSIKPCSMKKGDSGPMRYKFEICNIRYKFATDEHGMFNHNDEMVIYKVLGVSASIH
jgi:hypothetical protein